MYIRQVLSNNHDSHYYITQIIPYPAKSRGSNITHQTEGYERTTNAVGDTKKCAGSIDTINNDWNLTSIAACGEICYFFD